MAGSLLALCLFICLYMGTAAGGSCMVSCSKRVRTSTSCGLFGWSSCTAYRYVTTSCACGFGWRHDGECSGSCGSGVQRFVSESSCGCPIQYKTEACQNNNPCPVDGTWSSWSVVSSGCSVTCGGGVRTLYRTRSCVNRAYGGRDCPGLSSISETQSCNNVKCPLAAPPNPCLSSPCKNSATCVDHKDGTFHCQCMQGYGGVLCQNDIQPPVVNDCMDNFTSYVTTAKVTVEWTVPVFTDPMGSEIKVISNYPRNNSEFPWGDFTVQYTATKLLNAKQTECTFVVSVRPTPCDPLNIPQHGARVCNGWGTSYAQICMVFCSEDMSLPLGEDHRQLWVCGATGRWIPSRPLPDCSAQPVVPGVPIDDGYNVRDYTYSTCLDDDIRRTYVDTVKGSVFKDVCNLGEGCQPSQVTIDCD
ncbi:neurogenic locus notch homolog protein 1-like [Gigantopelta aegis]|uniref:neurogenic locus notch homolog protein 1-like n=1 Tax=Gigantopelta aegis TaxID=1735272 RepID=UPI001B88DB70|nr:neurogenic locus notch homolog protein 1-like [Gigantopelta aegis]